MNHTRTVRGVTREDLAVGFLNVIGLATGAAFLYGLRRGVDVPTVAVPTHPVGTAFLALPAAGLLVAGYCLRDGDFDDASIWRVGQFAVTGATAATFLAVLLLRSASLVDVPSGDLFVLLVGSAGEGALLGVVAGLAGVTRAGSTDDRATNERLVLLHRVLQHNLRNRVNVIGGYVDLMERDDDPGEHAPRVAAQIAAVNDLLDETRLAVEAATSTDRTAVDLSAMLRRNGSLLEETYPRASVETNVPADVHVLAVAGLEAAFENVFDNAVRHNDRDEPGVSISVDAGGDAVAVTVADDGPGIDEASKETVFEPATGGGHGLGLYLARELVERSGGELRVEDNQPRGTAVVLSLPRAGRDEA